MDPSKKEIRERLKEKDIEVALLLEKGESVAAIAKKLKEPKSTIYYHLAKLKRLEVIRGFKVKLDYETSSLKSAMVLVSLNVNSSRETAEFIDAVKKQKAVTEIDALLGEWDYSVIAGGEKTDVDGLLNQIRVMPNIKKTMTLFILSHTGL
jgi:DNA-binding Lrp family transcriptional regulator